MAYLAGMVRLRKQFDQERLGWHLSLPSGSNAPRTGLFAVHRDAPRSSGIGHRSGSSPTEHDTLDTASLDGLTVRVESHGIPPVEMRELQSPVPISVQAQRAVQLY
jgi:hypothetical protein